MKKLNIAIIGQGRSGKDIHGVYYLSERNVYYNVKYVVDYDERRRRISEERYPGCVTFADYRELLDKKDIDLVVNASFSDDHFYAVVKSSDTGVLLGKIHRLMPVNPMSPADLRAGVHAIDGSEHNAMHACDMADRDAGLGTEPSTDGVTGLPDVPHFLMTLESFRNQQRRGVLACEWDTVCISILNFSEYNSDNGFSAGDALLAEGGQDPVVDLGAAG